MSWSPDELRPLIEALQSKPVFRATGVAALVELTDVCLLEDGATRRDFKLQDAFDNIIAAVLNDEVTGPTDFGPNGYREIIEIQGNVFSEDTTTPVGSFLILTGDVPKVPSDREQVRNWLGSGIRHPSTVSDAVIDQFIRWYSALETPADAGLLGGAFQRLALIEAQDLMDIFDAFGAESAMEKLIAHQGQGFSDAGGIPKLAEAARLVKSGLPDEYARATVGL